eukprot:5343261-Amphidinium_carterae.1
MVDLGPAIHDWRQHQEQIFRSLHRACTPLRRFAARARPANHRWGLCPITAAAMIVLFGWQDTTLPHCLLFGFPLVGDVPPAHIYKAAPNKATLQRSELLGPPAVKFVDDLERDL